MLLDYPFLVSIVMTIIPTIEINLLYFVRLMVTMAIAPNFIVVITIVIVVAANVIKPGFLSSCSSANHNLNQVYQEFLLF